MDFTLHTWLTGLVDRHQCANYFLGNGMFFLYVDTTRFSNRYGTTEKKVLNVLRGPIYLLLRRYMLGRLKVVSFQKKRVLLAALACAKFAQYKIFFNVWQLYFSFSLTTDWYINTFSKATRTARREQWVALFFWLTKSRVRLAETLISQYKASQAE